MSAPLAVALPVAKAVNETPAMASGRTLLTTSSVSSYVLSNWKRLVAFVVFPLAALVLAPSRYKLLATGLAIVVGWVVSGRLFGAPSPSNAQSQAKSSAVAGPTAAASVSAVAPAPSAAVKDPSWAEMALEAIITEHFDTVPRQLKSSANFSYAFSPSRFYDCLGRIQVICNKHSAKLSLEEFTEAAYTLVRPTPLAERKCGIEGANDAELVKLNNTAIEQAFIMIAAAASKKSGVSMQSFFKQVVGDKQDISPDFFQAISRIAKTQHNVDIANI